MYACVEQSQVMLTKDHTKWNYETLQELIEGPLLNPKRMEEAMKVSRFIRKLMLFFHPFSHRFSDMARTKVRIPLGFKALVSLTLHQSRTCAGFGLDARCSPR
jgi:rapamycin-insensitive companion of mTOR